MKKTVPNYPVILPMIFSFLLLIVCIALCFRVGSLSDRLNQVQAQGKGSASEFQKLKSENQQLRQQLSSLTSESEKLKKENQALQDQYTAAQKIIAQSSSTHPGRTAPGSLKVAYLTFDDGPSKYTAGLLQTLKSSNVRATFFVVGTNAAKYPDIVRQARDNGNAVGIHCYDHDYSTLYASPSAFFSDFSRVRNLLQDILGTSPDICRFPGGTGNTVSDRYGAHFMQGILPQVLEMDVTPFDWDVDAGDAEAIPASTQKVVSSVTRQASKHSRPVILCHDTKKNTVAAIPSIISNLRQLGYTFDVLSPEAPTCRQNPV